MSPILEVNLQGIPFGSWRYDDQSIALPLGSSPVRGLGSIQIIPRFEGVDRL